MSGLPASLAGVGIGLRAPHVREVLAGGAAGLWLEVNAENYMSGGADLRALADLRERHPISVHGVGLSLGAAEPLNRVHAKRLRALVERAAPVFVSEHLAFSGVAGVYTNMLAPIPYNDESLHVVATKIDELQSLLGRQILIENPARYLEFYESSSSEPQFLRELVARTGCGLLCDLTNVYVSAANLGFDAGSYLKAFPGAAVQEIHLAGHATKQFGEAVVLLDDHGSAVSQPVWELWTQAVRCWGPVPAVIEWDTALPTLAALVAEAALAARAMRALQGAARCQT
ncbi:MAG: DUF692 domain-containing protein [Pseudomonadota bacterium]